MSQAAVRTGSSYLPQLEGLRAVAAGLVLLTHVASSAGAVTVPVVGVLLARGTWGVTLFFVLSGFLLTRPWARAARGEADAPRLGRYFLLRAARILPAYWIGLIAVVIATSGVGIAAVLSNVTLTQIYTGYLLQEYFQTWSLCTEVAFYLVLPLLAALVVRRSVRASLFGLAAMALIAPFWIFWVKESGFFGYAITWLPGHLDWFAAGMALAVLEPWLRGTRDLPQAWRFLTRPAVWGAGLVLGWALMVTPLGGPVGWVDMSGMQAVTQELVFGLAALSALGLLVVAMRPNPIYVRFLSGSFMQWAGRISYGVFLWQLLIITLVRTSLGLSFEGGGFLVTLLVAGGITVVIAQMSWLVVEKPILARAHRSMGRTIDLSEAGAASAPLTSPTRDSRE